ncbi:MAG: hypothetical protein MSG64_04720 [Pyrinomonadaceae bacterium MAG19_C2-C3]|nr:hypothetical protein [Pyrinomonadaceae bacterium MAG19_C2-C3]
MNASKKLVGFVLAFTGIAIGSIVFWLYPLFSPLIWLSIVLSLVVTVQLTAIYFLGRFHERTVARLESEKLSLVRKAIEQEGTKQIDDKAKKSRPKLTGFFQDFMAYDWTKPEVEDKNIKQEESRKVSLILLPVPTGTLVVMKVGFVNENPIPTTLHNFSFTIKCVDKTFTAKYPEEPFEVDGYLPPEMLAKEEEKRKANLVNYLDSSKVAEHGRRIQGSLVFYMDGFMWKEFTSEDWIMTLTITDAWGEGHDIVHWGELPRPSQRLNR